MEQKAELEQVFISSEEYESQPSEEAEDENARLEEYHELMMEMQQDLPAKGVPRIPGLSRKRVMQAFNDSFELIGGVPRMALWAHANPSEFYKIYARLLPAQATSLVQNNTQYIKHVLPPSALDD